MATLDMDRVWSPDQVELQIAPLIQRGTTLPKTRFLQSFFGDVNTTEDLSIAMDIEANRRNMVAEWVHPEGVPNEYKLPRSGFREYGFGYIKTMVTNNLSPNFARRLGELIGKGGDPNRLDEFQEQQMIALDSRFNRFELTARDLIFNGTYTAEGEKHPAIKFDFPKVTAATSAQYQGNSAIAWSKVDLTTLNHNGGVGKAVWSDSGNNSGTKIVDVLTDLSIWHKHFRDRHDGWASLIMSSNTFATFENNIQTVRADAKDLTKYVLAEDRIYAQFQPKLIPFKAVGLMRVVTINGVQVPIYVYDGVYTDVTTGIETKFVPDGYVIGMPDSSNQVIRYGRIMHYLAQWKAMPLWVQEYREPRTGAYEQTFHTSIFMGVKNPDAIMVCKVM